MGEEEEEEDEVRRRRAKWTWALSPLSNKRRVSTEMNFTHKKTQNKVRKCGPYFFLLHRATIKAHAVSFSFFPPQIKVQNLWLGKNSVGQAKPSWRGCFEAAEKEGELERRAREGEGA